MLAGEQLHKVGQRWDLLETLKLETGSEEGIGTRKATRAAPRWEARRSKGEVRGWGVARGNKRKPVIPISHLC